MTNPTAAMLVIGDEILSGRTRDSNMHHLARELTRVGAPQPDEHESFEAQQLSLDQVRAAIASGEITHSLVVAAFHLLDVSGELS